MKWKIAYNNWKRWFAWYPVEARGSHIWLEWVERKDMGGYFYFREINTTSTD